MNTPLILVSLLAVLSAGIRLSDVCRLNISGSDETEAMAVLSRFLSPDFHRRHGTLSSESNEIRATTSRVRGLLAPGLIVLDAICRTKADAIQQAVNRLQIAGRTRQPTMIKQSIWQREAAGSTAFGHGFAIPHCQSSAVLKNSLVILKTRTPIDWESSDHAPVNLIILMAVRAGDRVNGHLQIFSQLARQLMDAAFRQHLLGETDPAALCVFLKASLHD